MLAALGFLVAESYNPLFPTTSIIGPAINHYQQVAINVYPAFTW